MARPERLTEPHLLAITAAPQHKPVPTSLSTIFYLCPPEAVILRQASTLSLNSPLILPSHPLPHHHSQRGHNPAQSLPGSKPSHGSPFLPQAEVKAREPGTPASSPASLPFTHIGLQLPVFQTHAVHIHFQVFLQAAPDAQNVSASPMCVQPSRPSKALHNPSSKQLSFIFQMSPDPLPSLNSPDQSAQNSRDLGACPSAPLARPSSHI